MNGYYIAWILIILFGAITKDHFESKMGAYNYGFVIGCLSIVLLNLAKGVV